MDLNHYQDAKEQIRAFGGHLVVNNVNPGTRAKAMGLRSGDAIKRINGKDMNTVSDVLAAVQKSESLKIEIIREQNSVTLDECSGNK